MGVVLPGARGYICEFLLASAGSALVAYLTPGPNHHALGIAVGCFVAAPASNIILTQMRRITLWRQMISRLDETSRRLRGAWWDIPLRGVVRILRHIRDREL